MDTHYRLQQILYNTYKSTNHFDENATLISINLLNSNENATLITDILTNNTTLEEVLHRYNYQT